MAKKTGETKTTQLRHILRRTLVDNPETVKDYTDALYEMDNVEFPNNAFLASARCSNAIKPNVTILLFSLIHPNKILPTSENKFFNLCKDTVADKFPM